MFIFTLKKNVQERSNPFERIKVYFRYKSRPNISREKKHFHKLRLKLNPIYLYHLILDRLIEYRKHHLICIVNIIQKNTWNNKLVG